MHKAGTDSGSPARQAVSAALAALDLYQLIGLTLEQASTRIQAIGGVVRSVEGGPTISVDWSYRANRVTVLIRDDIIVRTLNKLGISAPLPRTSVLGRI